MSPKEQTDTNRSGVSTTGLLMPTEFPVAAYERIHAKVQPLRDASPAAMNEFAGAWNAISYRYVAFVECDEAFRNSLAAHGTAPPALERYNQERDLFGFFSNGFSTFESFFYAAFAMLCLLKPNDFQIGTPQQQRNVTGTNTVSAYRRAFTPNSIIEALETLLKDPTYVELREIRNILSHRSAPGRTIHVAFGDEPAPDQWKIANIVLNERTTFTRRQGVAVTLTKAITALLQFAEQQLRV